MTNSESWSCDGIPKNGKKYPEFEPHKLHPPELNYGADCAVCGLPKEAMAKPQRNLTPILIAMAVGGIVLIGGGIGYFALAGKCDPGLQKIDGECIDPYSQPYQTAKQQGDAAVQLANNYQTIEDLEKAQLSLSAVFNQLNQIPEDATIYSEVKSQLQTYQPEPTKIDANLKKETQARANLSAAQAIAAQAAQETNTAQSSTQLNSAKQKWQEAQSQLAAIANDTLLAAQITQLQTEYSHKITELDGRIAALNQRNMPQIVTPVKVTPQPQPRSQPQPQPKPRPKATPKPVVKPGDPCAVPNPPANCLF